MSPINAQEVLHFWFEELSPDDWFKKDQKLDEKIKSKFSKTLLKARFCELSDWRICPQGRLAEIIVLDQFSRNIFRNDPRSFESDPLALCLSQEAISLGVDQELSIIQRPFLYMPFMHSESLKIHQKALELFSSSGMDKNLDFEIRHKKLIERFGRYPHRNEILGRASTREEIEFLKTPGSSF